MDVLEKNSQCLDTDFLLMTKLFLETATGKIKNIAGKGNLNKIEYYSKEHGVGPMVFAAMQKHYLDGALLDWCIPKELYNRMLKSFLAESSYQILRQYNIENLLDALEREKIEYCVLKGESLSHLYKEPVLRISTDTDIFIEWKYRERVTCVLKEEGYKVYPLIANAHHFQAYHPATGIVEIHISLFSEAGWLVVSRGKESWRREEDYIFIPASSGRMIPTLGITDQFIYITLHAIKHFVTRGLGLRQTMDVLLYARHYSEKINWDKFYDVLIRYNFQYFFSHLIGIGERIFDISCGDKRSFGYNPQLLEEILLDMQLGGIFGKGEKNRAYYHLYLEKEMYEDSSNFKAVNKLDYYRKLLIPPRENMLLRFPYLETKPYLYLYAILHRIVIQLKLILTGRINFNQLVFRKSNAVFLRRGELLRKLKLTDRKVLETGD